jgi:hypothetical protein
MRIYKLRFLNYNNNLLNDDKIYKLKIFILLNNIFWLLIKNINIIIEWYKKKKLKEENTVSKPKKILTISKQVENTKAFKLTIIKELGKLIP